MLDNFGMIELLVLAALAYASYKAFTSVNKKGEKNTLAALLIAIPGVLLLNSAGTDTDTFGADAGTSPSGIVAANFSGTEMLYVASIGYGAWLLYSAGEITAATSAVVAALILLWNANDSTSTF